MNLSRRVAVLEDRLTVTESAEDRFVGSLLVFRYSMLKLHHHDSRRDLSAGPGENLQRLLDIKDMDLPAFRRHIESEIPRFAPHTYIDQEWSPIHGFSDEVRKKRHYDRPMPWETRMESPS